MQFDDNLLLGPVIPGGPSIAGLQAGNDTEGSSPQFRGIGPCGRIFVYDIVPATVSTTNLAAGQTLAGAGVLTLSASAGVTKVTRGDGTTAYQFDVPRGVSLTSTGVISAVNFTVSGYDVYGQAMSEVIAGPNANTVNTKKAFYQVTSIATNAAVATDTSAGTSDVYGLPAVAGDAGYIASVKWAGALAQDAGTFTKADATSPATSATGDVRGTYAPSSASNGANRLVIGLLLADAVAGPAASRSGALGVTQA